MRQFESSSNGHKRALVLNVIDNVAVALTPLAAGDMVNCDGASRGCLIEARMAIPVGHKMALCSLHPGDKVIKYGQPVGLVTQDIAAGEHVHIHNVVSARAG